MGEFTAGPGSSLRVRLEEHEADVMRNLLLEMNTMLDAGPPSDPVIERLFPRAYTEESDENTYREMVGSDLERGKKKALERVRRSIGNEGPVDLQLSREDADEWLTALTDIRLAIGTRIDVTEEMMGEELDPEDPRAPAMAVLHWLGWVQESMVDRLSDKEE